VTDDDQKTNAVPDHRFSLIRRVANAAVVRERHPASRSLFCEPLFVRGVRSEVVAVTFDYEPCFFQDLRKTEAEVSVREVDHARAARSKTTASSTASRVSS
jgi:hypothetical protein